MGMVRTSSDTEKLVQWRGEKAVAMGPTLPGPHHQWDLGVCYERKTYNKEIF